MNNWNGKKKKEKETCENYRGYYNCLGNPMKC